MHSYYLTFLIISDYIDIIFEDSNILMVSFNEMGNLSEFLNRQVFVSNKII